MTTNSKQSSTEEVNYVFFFYTRQHRSYKQYTAFLKFFLLEKNQTCIVS